MSDPKIPEVPEETGSTEAPQTEPVVQTWEEELDAAKNNYFIVKNTIDHREEPLEVMKDLSAFIEKVVEDPTKIEATEEVKEFFYKECTFNILKRLNKERSNDSNYLEAVAVVMKQFTRLFAKKVDEIELAEHMKFVFDPNCMLHTYHYQDAQSELKIMEQKKKEQWRHDLKIGDKIDALKGDEKHKCWGVAIISEIRDELLDLEMENDSKNYDKLVNRFSGDIAPLGEFTKDQEWKGEIKPGDEVDAFDKAKVWYSSTVLEVKEHKEHDGRAWEMLKIGFRLYREDAQKTDDDGKKYEGWSARFDEWVPRWSPKISKLYSQAKPKAGRGTRLYEETVIDDSSDIQIKEGDAPVFAVTRPNRCKSSLLAECINIFGESGGFEQIISKVSDKENPINLELLAYYMECLGRIYPMYHRDFIAEFAPKIKEGVLNAIFNAPEDSIRNIRKEKIEQIVNRLGDVLKRVMNFDERDRTLENLNMNISLMCLKSNFLERRIHGIKSLAEALKGLKYARTSKMSGEHMLEWIQSNKILDIIFDHKNYHVQIIQRSKEILKFLITEDQLSSEQLDLFWKGTSFDDESRREIYKIIEEVSSVMKSHHVMQFLDKFTSDKEVKIIPEAVNCIFEMGKSAQASSEHTAAIAELLWRFATDDKNPFDVSDIAITKLGDLLKKWKFSTAKSYFYKCLDNLKNHYSSIESLKILKKVIKDVDYSPFNFESEESGSLATEDATNQEEEKEKITSKGDAIVFFIQEENLLEIFLDNLRSYSKVSQSRIGDVKDKSKISEFKFEGRYDHKTNINERLEFLKFLAANSTFTISRKEVDVIWSCLVDESKIGFDEEALFKWLKESCESSAGSNQVWELEDIGAIFNERFGKGSGEMSSLTLDGFYCMQSYFLLANETAEKLERIVKSKVKTVGVTSFGNDIGPSFSTFSFNRLRKPKKEEPEVKATFKVLIEPKDLEGINNIWKIAIECTNQEVSKKATEFLIELYYNLCPSLEEKKKEINYECIETALGFLSAIQSNAEKSEETKSVEIINVLGIFNEFLAQSERKGTTGLKQQRSLLKGELLNKISITNSVSYNKLIGRKIELSLYSNATVHDIKRVLGAINKVPAEYVKLIRSSTSQEIKDIDNGKTLSELNFKPNEVLIAAKQNLGNIPKAPLLNKDKSLSKEAQDIFGEWFDNFSHEGLMTPEDCVEFIRSCTDDKCKTTDNRVKNLFANHDYDGDGKVDKAGFVEFYRQSCLRKEEVVRSNILAHNYTNDLKKISDACEENTDKTILPRFILSHESKYFETLLGLLDRTDDSSKEAWNLIQKLVTNPTIYSKILNLNVTKGEDGVYNWDTLFDTKSIFKLLYMFQIIESLIEEGGEGEEEICKVFKNKEPAKPKAPMSGGYGQQAKNKQEEEKDKNEKEKEEVEKPKEYLVSELLASNQKDREEALKEEAETRELKKTWIFRFLEKEGFEFSYKLFSNTQNDIRNMNSFEKNFLGFILKILRIFITSAFLAVEPEVANLVKLAKKRSIAKPPPTAEPEEEDNWGADSQDDDEENIYSTPTGKKPISRTMVIDESGNFYDMDADGNDIGMSTEDYLFNDDLDSDKAVGGSDNDEEDVPLKKKVSSLKIKSEVDPVEKKIEMLASQLKGDLGDKMLKVIDFSQLQIIVLQSIASLVSKEEMDFDEKKIVENSLSLWLGCILHNPKILDNFFTFKCNEFEDVHDLILRGILYPSLFKIREEFLHTLFLFATKIENAKESTFEYTLKAMLNKLPKDNEGEESCTSQYFELVSKLIEEYFIRIQNGNVNKEILDATKFFTEVIEKIKSHQSREVRNSLKQDETLIGYLKIAHMVLDRGGLGECVEIAINHDFIAELFTRCLFPNNISVSDEDVTEGTDLASSLLAGNKCKTEESRKWAYKLLWTLCNNSITLLNQLIVNQMQPLCKQIRLHPSWMYTPSGDTRKGKFSGIRNLGCICYMNSMLQQLYHVPSFRYQLLQADDGTAPDWIDYKGRTIDDNVLHQLQRLFGHLELSEKVDYNPFEFCYSFKQPDGQPTNTSVQHDTEEFYNILFDRIENLIKPTPQKYLFNSTFNGQNCSQMVCKECGFARNRFEDFYNVSVTVKERKSLEESIKKTLEGEVISDYECPGCKKKVDITKRTLFSKTPNVLVVQLQRLIFDFNTFQNQKVNTHFEFPENLDLSQYSLNHVMKEEGKLTDKELGKAPPGEEESDEEGEDEYEGMTEEEKKERIEEKELYIKNVRDNENECYEYKLVGVIIHVGTADAGHYYSLINTDRFQKENEHEDEWLDTSKDKWMEFNDSRVSDYNYEELKGDCYGGSSGNDDWFGGMFKSSSYGKSAYLLVYEKRFKKPIKILIPEEKEGEEQSNTNKAIVPANAVIQTDPKTNERFYEITMKEAKMFVPNKIYKEIWSNNLEFSFEKLIYSKEFYEYVKELMAGTLTFKQKQESLPDADTEQIDEVISNVAKVGNKIVYEVLVKAYHNHKLPEVAETLGKLYLASDKAVLDTMEYFLEEENSDEILYVFQILLSCNDKVSRNSTARLVSTLVNRCFEIEKDYLNETEKVTIKVTEELISTGEDEKTEQEVDKEIIRPKSMAVRFYDLAVNALKTKGPSSWNKFEQYLNMLKDIMTGGEAQLNMVMERGGIIDFIDFMLAQNSPLYKAGEKRTKMGSHYATPAFGPLLEAISHLIVRSYTPQFDKDSEEKPATFNAEAEKHYDLKEEDITTFLLHPEFLKLAIMNSNEMLGKAFSHISYKNLEASKEIGKIILKTINTTDYDKIKNCMVVAKQYLYVNDEFQRNRAEWILGFSCLNSKLSNPEGLPRFGVSNCHSQVDEVYQYMCPLDLNERQHSLLSLLTKYRGKMDLYVVNCLNILFDIIVGSEFLLEYMFNLDPLTYEYARFTDWIRPYLQKELDKALRSVSAYSKNNKKEESIKKCFSYLENFEAKLRNYNRRLQGLPEEEEEKKEVAPEEETKEKTQEEEKKQEIPMEIIEAIPKRYIINCATKVEKIHEEVREDGSISMIVHKVYCEIAESQPTYNGNETLPSYAFHNAKQEAAEYEQKHLELLRQEQEAEGDDERQGHPKESVSNLDDDVQIGVNKVSINKKNEGDEEESSDWTLPKRETDFVLVASIANEFSKALVVDMKLVCEDDLARENIKAPVNNIEATIKPMNQEMWMVLHKVDPDKDWGKFKFEWNFKDKKAEARNVTQFMYDDRDNMDHLMMMGPNIHSNFYSMI